MQKIKKYFFMFLICFCVMFSHSMTIFANEYILPNYVGKNINDIQNELDSQNFEIIYNYEYNDTIPVDVVISQSIPENTICDENTSLTIVISNGSASVADNVDLSQTESSNYATNSFGLGHTSSGTPIVIDGDYSDWVDKPYSYEFNWDNSANCWYWGVWIDGVCYLTKEGTYDTNVRHLMQLYSDGEYIYLHIIFSKNYEYLQNGNDYQFYVDGNMAAFQVETMDRENFVNHAFPVGITELLVSHRDASMSYCPAIDSKAYITVYNEENILNEMELKIPLSELQRQNNSINLDEIGIIEYFCPNLMYQRISCVGTSTGPIIFALLSIGTFTGIYFYKKKQTTK